MRSDPSRSAADRLKMYAMEWRVVVDATTETASSMVAYGRRHGEAVVLKIVRRTGDEWGSGQVLHSFGGRGVVRVLEYTDGAMLLEALSPGHSLVQLVLDGRDETATQVLAGVIGAMSPGAPVDCPSVELWGRGFDWYASSDDRVIPRELVDEAKESYAELCRTQKNVRLLHGDLQHSNVLFDAERGWVAVDPKGVIGEPEYEVGALLRNPTEAPQVFANRVTIERRIEVLQSELHLNRDRMLRWAFAQAVLSAIWCVQDGEPAECSTRSLTVATAIRRILR